MSTKYEISLFKARFGMISRNSLVKGLILVIVGDAGPEVVANLSDITDENALITGLHLVSLAGLEDENRDEDASKMIGPLPVKGTSNLKSLFYSDFIKATDAQDERIIEHGAKVGIILLFETEKLPEIRRAAGLIEPYLQIYLNKAGETAELTKDFSESLLKHLIDLISRPRLRSFVVTEEKLYENKDPNYINSQADVVLIDEEHKKIYLLTQKETSPFVKRQIRNRVNELNFELYQSGYSIVTLESFGEIERLLIKHNIKVI